VYHIILEEGSNLVLPAAKKGVEINRRAFYIEGDSLTINGEKCDPKTAITLDASVDAKFANAAGSSKTTEVLVLQGRPIGEPVAQRGPFVMNTQAEIRCY
jgi:redox-sensitive bicupin YhaK (pirin superfamily)